MYTFRDYYNNEIKLSFDYLPFSKNPKHVWIVCKYRGQWLLTKHKDRGLEFPGGKVEEGETPEEAAIREVKEETGGLVKNMNYMGQYFVSGKKEDVVKNVYYASIQALEKQDTYYETDGPILLETIPLNVKYQNCYSFIMKDDVLEHCIQYIHQHY
ncbi:MAG: RNA deprotection pyrophosphohydrolase [Bacillota bacterium]|uniref:Nucleoside triphosphatase YtkD n=1 Tax=Virgibacillus salarius TaxID=447199 RepID=A0A941I7J2_9BACI|nr:MULTISPECIES: nucleoside triphosphatase YtkD [Bacillaceae]NAZ07291.1 nucleoside triphosphatase YtkD [Agaribacter marinus]MBR7794569.1 nucleoside triphosphatase YtkD [Virgibacillus salarius]MCC2249442.1 nucleoside triphosphatase YtkD [Virgibacillus sp. AGTR]MDY7043360.1 nucleoside triphosphatase YtkD [Virgibacillus sp. M23]QRZ17810.1 nucleoside triphosphatase YtkD [Virgibacillus sp. AGTR]